MKKIVALVLCAGAVPAWAADVGVGVSVESHDSTIYVPIDFGETFRVEPFVNFSKAKSNSYGYRSSMETLQIGTGLFALKPLGDSVRLYYGGRLSYLDLESTANYFGGPNYYFDTHEGSGFRVAPTLGFEYAFNKHLSFGAEAAWFYQDIDGSGYANAGDIDERSTGTDTRLILRLRF